MTKNEVKEIIREETGEGCAGIILSLVFLISLFFIVLNFAKDYKSLRDRVEQLEKERK